MKCFELRLSEAAKKAKEVGADYFASTLTISPMKNASLLNKISEECGTIYNVQNLPSDFKKNGYKRSIELSKEYNLYRQDYCGCIFQKKKKKPDSTSLKTHTHHQIILHHIFPVLFRKLFFASLQCRL